MSGRQIKGGGRAIMSRESQEAVIDLLMRLSSSEDEPCESTERKTVSEHEQKHRKKKFVRKLIREHERKQCQRKFRKHVTTTGGNGDTSNPFQTPPTAAAPTILALANTANRKANSSNRTTSNININSNSNEKVRIELVEAIFKDNKKEKKEKKAKKDKKKTSSSTSSEIKFKEGIKKVMVLPRSTNTKELLKLASAKLKMKKPLRVFVKVSKTTHWNLGEDGNNDNLSGVDDGAALYVTITPEPSLENKETGKSNENENDLEEGNDIDPIEENGDNAVDPLDLVKRAYERQEQTRRNRHHHNHRRQNVVSSNGNGIHESTMAIDEEQKAKHARVRSELPAASYKETILDSVRDNTVVVLCGATGCGKSTQIPQFLLEHDEAREKAHAKQQQHSQFQHEQEQTDSKLLLLPHNHHPKYIVVTQPRKVAAIALANRVADERGSPPPGEAGSSVGYMVRSDRRVDERSCRIIYMTVGILLRMLVSQSSQSKPQTPEEGNPRSSFSIHNISHLIIDEVHERDVNTDFTLTLLKGLMLSSSASSSGLSHLRLILMSATASSDLFVDYFTPTSKNRSHPCANAALGKPPVVLEIPGRTFPVEIKWLPECQRFSGATLWRPSNNSNCNTSQNEIENDARTNSNNSGSPALSPRARDKIDDKFVRALIAQIVQQQQSEGQLLQRTAGAGGAVNNHANNNHENGAYRKTGAILVFLPGRGEIESLAACLYDPSTIVGDREICTILKLHSAIPKNEQQKVFRRALEGTVKIVLATNIAETSVTISDVTHVIDACRVKESRYNASTRIRELVTVWTSQASLKQRAGRAGRTSAGICWRLCSEDFCRKELPPQTAPEMLRTPLDELVLQICLLYEQRRDDFYKSQKGGSGSFAAGAQPIKFLSLTPAPPPKNSLLQACRHLLEVDALRVVDTNGREGEEDAWSYRLTPLGYHLSRLPMDAKVGKVLIVGCILGCLDGALTVAATLSCTKTCFLSGFGNPANLPVAFQARESLIENGFGGKDWPGGTVKGDLIAVIAAYRAWKKHRSDGQKWKFCSNHAMDNTALREMDRLRNQFKDLLIDAGFVARHEQQRSKQRTIEAEGSSHCNQASEDALLTSCCLVAGLYPNICSLIRPRKGGPKGGRLYTNDGDECRPQSNSFQRKRLQQAAESGKDAYAVYHAKHRSIGTVSSSGGQRQRPPEVFLREVNFVSRFALLLFGGDLEIVKNAIVVDRWLKFKVSGDEDKTESKKGSNKDTVDNAVLILALRETLDEMILEHILESSAASGSAENSRVSSERHKGVIRVVRKLLSEEG